VLADREIGRRPDVGRFVVASLAAATAVLVAWQLRNDHVSSDRTTAVRAGHLLLDGGLNVYTVWPQAQMGPLALAVAGLLPTALFIVVVGGAAGLFVQLGYLATGARATPWHGVGAVLVGAAWQRWVFTGHADDVLVLVGLATLLVGVRRRSGWLAAAGLLLGLLGKPTAIVFVPLVWWVDRRSTGWALAAAAACWLPFFLVDPAGFLRAGEGIMSVRPDSLWGLLGVTGAYPHYVRPLQLILAWTAGLLLVRRSGPAAAALVAVVLRAALEPAPMPLYWMSVVAVAFLVDLPRRVPVVTAVAFLGFVLDLHDSRSVGAGLLRLALLLVVAVLGALLGQRTPECCHPGFTGNRSPA
jgi:hypothetical protein